MTTGWRRWAPSIVMMLCSWLSYVDRHMLAVLAPLILAQTGLNAEAYGRVVAAFSFAYMLANPLWGSLIDRIGVRAGMMAAVSLWSAASAAHALMTTAWGFAVARALLGFGEGATFPGGLRTAVESLPADRQSRGIAIAYSGGSLGAILTPLMVTPVALLWGWRAAFVLTGLLGLLWLPLWWAVTRTPHFGRVTRSPAWRWPDPRQGRFWALAGCYALGAGAIGPVLYLSPLYLNQVLGLSQQELGRLLWIPPLGWELGYFLWGWIVDLQTARHRRPLALLWLMATLAIPIVVLPALKSPAAVLALLFWTLFVGSGFIVFSLRTAVLMFGAHQTALVAGIGAGAWSALVMILLPLLGRWFDYKDYQRIFTLLAVLPQAGALVWTLCSRHGQARQQVGRSASS